MEILTVRNISDILQVSRWKVYQLLRTDELVGFRVGRQWRVTPEAFTDYIKGNKELCLKS